MAMTMSANMSATMSVSNREQAFINAAAVQAEKSDILMRHGCIAVANGKIMGRGYNHRRTKSKDAFIQNSCTCHAEMGALRDMYHSCFTNVYGNYMDSIKGPGEEHEDV